MTAVNTSSTASSAASAAAAANTQAQQSLSSNYQEFLQLLTTSLQNQDPTNPTDTNQLTEEIAQLSQVQGQLQTNTDLAQLISLVSSQISNDAVSYIGKQVDSTPVSGSPAQTELAGGQATLVYDLPAGATSSTVTITNSAGQTVYSAAGTTVDGRNQVVWSGTTNAGTTATDGTYNFSVTATDTSGKSLTVTPLTTGIVQSVDTQGGTTTLSLGGTLTVPLSSVSATYTAGTNPGTSIN